MIWGGGASFSKPKWGRLFQVMVGIIGGPGGSVTGSGGAA